MKASSLGSMTVLLVAAALPVYAADREDAADPQSTAIEIAMSIGQLQALADICAAPAWSYETQLGSATSAMLGIYADAGLQPRESDGDIAAGRKAEVSRRDDPAWPLDCNRFRHEVSYMVARVAEASGQSAPPLAPVDQADWRSHPPGIAAPSETPFQTFRLQAKPPVIEPAPAAPEPASSDSPAPDSSYKTDIP